MRESTIGGRIRMRRLRKDWRPERLAAELRVSGRSVARWESGEVLPNATNAKQLAAVLGGRAEDYVEEAA